MSENGAARPVLIFDMDGVLAEVSESYDESIIQTVRHFTGATVAREAIYDYRIRGGFNNDWLLSQQLCRDQGVDLPYTMVVDYFCKIFFGENNDGLVSREQWVPSDGLLDRLAKRYQLAIFTGRNQAEVAVTLNKYASTLRFDPLLTTDEVVKGKPAPDGLNMIREQTGASRLYFVGDTMDDARSASAAGVAFIGIAAASNPRCGALVAAMRAEHAMAIIESVNQLEGVLP
ncbi:MAG TPA: HAD-IA family hydrolase [Bryobacteraceae bacterium]|nr:HAD-IA family hydrolase [Bryobacteraceae bacterium]HPT26905.1 HAD-IA family hydrolase [Bryobacteraceae bacterium]